MNEQDHKEQDTCADKVPCDGWGEMSTQGKSLQAAEVRLHMLQVKVCSSNRHHMQRGNGNSR